MIIDGSFSDEFHAWGFLALALAWVLVLAIAVVRVLERSVGIEGPGLSRGLG